MEFLHCPQCRTPLRLRSRPTNPLKVLCPDCQSPLEIAEDYNQSLVVRVSDETPLGSATRPIPLKAGAASAIPPAGSGRWAALKPIVLQRLTDPLVVTWIAASITAIGLGIAFFQASKSSPTVVASRPADPDQQIEKKDGSLTPPVEMAEATQQTPREEPAVTDSAVDLTPSRPESVQVQAPLEAEKPTAVSKVDPRDLIREHLVQRFVRFEQPVPVPFDTIRLQLEELAGVPIRYDDQVPENSASRQSLITLAFDDATIQTVLEEAARQASLGVLVAQDGILLVTEASVQHPDETLATEP